MPSKYAFSNTPTLVHICSSSEGSWSDVTSNAMLDKFSEENAMLVRVPRRLPDFTSVLRLLLARQASQILTCFVRLLHVVRWCTVTPSTGWQRIDADTKGCGD